MAESEGIELTKARASARARAFWAADLEEALPYLVPVGFFPLGFDQNTGKKIIEFFFYREISISYRENSIISRIIKNYRVFSISSCKGNADQEIPKKYREF